MPIILRTALALLSGVMITLSFPRWNLGFLSWIALVPMLMATRALNFRKSFFLGWFTGWAAFCGILYWIVPTFQAAEVSTVVAFLTTILLAGYVGIYYGLFAAISQSLFLEESLPQNKIFPLLKNGGLFFSAALWVGLEYLRNFLFTGYPWENLGFSQWQYSPIIQISEWTGVYGVSFLILLTNLFLFQSIRIFMSRQTGSVAKKISLRLLFMTLTLTALWGWGYRTGQKYNSAEGSSALSAADRTRSSAKGAEGSSALSAADCTRSSAKGAEGTKLNVTILQGNIDQYKKWNQEYVREILNSYSGLLAKLNSETGQNPSGLIVWPETSAPGWLPQEEWLLKWVQKNVKNSGCFNIVGAVTKEKEKNYNSAFLFAPDGTAAGRYDKIHLVPFGEFVPLQSLLGRWIPVLNLLGGFHSGEGARLLEIPAAKLGITICYESIFPELFRESASRGAGILVNLTNDGWYLDTAAPEQHFAINLFRAVENRRYLIRAANTGISGIVRPDGTILKRSQLNEKTFLTATVSCLTGKTFYTRHGDLFARLCVAISLTMILASIAGLTFFSKKEKE